VRITGCVVAPVIKDGFFSSMTYNNIRRGFRETGRTPFCPRMFDENDFEPPESLTGDKYSGESQTNVSGSIRNRDIEMSQETPSSTAKEPGVPGINVRKCGLSCSTKDVPAFNRNSDFSPTHCILVSWI
jgi:hypothetical protein